LTEHCKAYLTYKLKYVQSEKRGLAIIEW